MFDAFYSDPHFGHEMVATKSRGFDSTREMTTSLIDTYNSVVMPHHLVAWLGDCFFCGPEESADILKRLNGHKVLVRGNHDGSAAKMARLGFSMVVDEAATHIAGQRVRMSHFPPAHYRDPRYPNGDKRHIDRRPKLNPGEWLVHGHTHSDVRLRGKCIHVGVDAWNLGPVRGSEVAALIQGASEEL